MRAKLAYFAAAGILVASLAACGTSDEDSSKSTRVFDVKNDSSQEVEQSAPAPTVAPGTTLTAVNNPELGDIVVDSEGFTLYRFDKDTANPPASNCNGDCAATWPPSLSPVDWKEVKLEGIDKSLVSFVERADGTCQLTIAGWPIYRYAPDAQPGDIKGQGIGGTWFAVTPEGKKASAQVEQPEPGKSTAPNSNKNDSGYGY